MAVYQGSCRQHQPLSPEGSITEQENLSRYTPPEFENNSRNHGTVGKDARKLEVHVMSATMSDLRNAEVEDHELDEGTEEPTRELDEEATVGRARAPSHSQRLTSTRTVPDIEVSVNAEAVERTFAVEEDVGSKLTFFLDGEKPIDFVLAYKIRNQEQDGTNPYVTAKRNRFLQQLELAKIDMEKSKTIQRSGEVTYFIKLHLPWDLLKDWAEKLLMRAPLQQAPGAVQNMSKAVLKWLKVPSQFNILDREVPSLPLHYYTAQFRADRLEHYVFKDDPTKLFSRSQRSYIAYQILETIVYGDERKGQIGLPRLLQEDVFQAAFPLHDGALNEELGRRKQFLNNCQRQILRDHWASFRCIFRYQPVGHIRSYFGEQITLYFAWLGVYTGWLIPLALLGVFAFIYGLVTLAEDPIVNDVCTNGGQYEMCPICDNCPTWDLKQACSGKKAGYVFDNFATCVLAFLISVWSVMIVEFWKRKNAELAHFFDCDDLQDEDEHPRALFIRHAPMMRRNAVTGQLEPYVPGTTLFLRRLTSWIASISIVLLIFLVTFGIILLRTGLKAGLIRKYGMNRPEASAAGPIATVVNLATILTLDYVYVKIASRLTDWELHRTQREHEESLAWKAYWFQFVNVFAPMFYLAFLKGRFVGSPGSYRRVAGMMLETCDIGGCFSELGMQLIITMCGKQIATNIAEYFVPIVQRIARARMGRLQAGTELNATFLDHQYKMVEHTGLTAEYMETVIQFGFIVLFGAAFPLAALASLVNNVLEIRLDAKKLIVNCRRPLAQRARSIGIWLHVLRWMTVLSVSETLRKSTLADLQGAGQSCVWVNAFLIAFTSDTPAEMLYAAEHGQSMHGYINHSLATSPVATGVPTCRYESFRSKGGKFNKFYYELTVLRLTFVLCYVAFVYGICTAISYMIPDIPKHVLDARNRRRFLATQALQSTPAAAQEAYTRVRTSIQANPRALKVLLNPEKFRQKYQRAEPPT